MIELKKDSAEKIKAFSTKSAVIRFLHSEGFSRGDIVRIFKQQLSIEIRYQHVRNVLITKVNNPTEK